jgi:RNA-directed DNA polymerase
MADVKRHTEGWQTLPWNDIQGNVYRLQRRIYQAALRGDWQGMHNLQRLLLCSWSARCLAVRKVTQDNRGKRTAGVDGVASLTAEERIELVDELRKLSQKADPVRRIYIPKSNGEQRPLGIPTMRNRALQALVKLALEPEWEAQFEPNSYGFRPGRSAHDAIEAIYNFIRLKPKFVLDADIEKCFDRINHEKLLEKLRTIPILEKLIRGWLKAGIIDQDEKIFPETGTPQGSIVSPLLANIALHGLETHLNNCLPKTRRPGIIRYADDFVILYHNLEMLKMLKRETESWLAEIGLRLKPAKTRITHTLNPYEDHIGFDFLGFEVRQYHVGKYHTRTYRGKTGFKTLIKPGKKAQKHHLRQIRQIIRQHRGSNQAALIASLNPVIRGWSAYFSTVVSKKILDRMDKEIIRMILQWAKWRHRNKSSQWRYHKYWRKEDTRMVFSDGKNKLIFHRDRQIQRHTKIIATKSPFDGDWIYWATRIGKDPNKPLRVTKLLKIQQGRCNNCALPFMVEDIMEVHHIDGNRYDNRYINLELLHGHCHDQIHARQCS